MEWRDEGVVIGLKRLGESSAVLEAMTRAHGRHLGLVRGARSSRLAAVLQPGNTVGLVWRARLDEHLGAFVVEPLTLRTGRFLPSAMALAGLNLVGALLRLLPERDPHEGLFETVTAVIEALDDASLAPAMLARFEARMLVECGFALDLTECAATGAREALIYVSPKSGRAVSAAAGAPYSDRLLPLPAFLRDGGLDATPDEIVDAFRLTGFFLDRELFAPRGLKLPEARGDGDDGDGAGAPTRGAARFARQRFHRQIKSDLIAARAQRQLHVGVPIVDAKAEPSAGNALNLDVEIKQRRQPCGDDEKDERDQAGTRRRTQRHVEWPWAGKARGRRLVDPTLLDNSYNNGDSL